VLPPSSGRNVDRQFKETYKILRVKKVQTTPYHPISNGVIERFHRTLHDGSLMPMEQIGI
jgi:transposase InsO family protein